jgi:hypothetical protein
MQAVWLSIVPVTVATLPILPIYAVLQRRMVN